METQLVSYRILIVRQNMLCRFSQSSLKPCRADHHNQRNSRFTSAGFRTLGSIHACLWIRPVCFMCWSLLRKYTYYFLVLKEKSFVFFTKVPCEPPRKSSWSGSSWVEPKVSHVVNHSSRSAGINENLLVLGVLWILLIWFNEQRGWWKRLSLPITCNNIDLGKVTRLGLIKLIVFLHRCSGRCAQRGKQNLIEFIKERNIVVTLESRDEAGLASSSPDEASHLDEMN